ncbi:MAG: hypothetical protein HY805_04105 [Nitrospirae bacterium]|nr:hypothetical protein [Nitrospirota bacterium]
MPKNLIKTLAVFLILIAIIGGRVLYLQRSHFLKAEEYYKASNYKLAIREYDTSMHFYVPFSPYAEKARQRLWDMAKGFEKEDKNEWAHMAYSSIRSSLYGVRSLFTPSKKWIEKCDEKLADLNVRMLLKEGSIKIEDANSERAKHLYTLKVDRAPKPLWTLLAALGFFGWLASVIFIIFRGFNKEGKVRRNALRKAVLTLMLFFLIWVVSLLKA